jgi:hypothetical protein
MLEIDSQGTIDLEISVYKHLAIPKTMDQLQKLFSESGDHSNRMRIQLALNRLLEKRQVRRARFVAGSAKYSTYQLFGPLTCKTYFYRTDRQEALLDLLSRSIDVTRIGDGGLGRSLAIHLRRILPEEIVLRLLTPDFDSGFEPQQLTRNGEIRMDCYCKGMRKHVRITGNPIGICGSSLIRAVACEESNCPFQNDFDCVIGKIRDPARNTR